MDVDADVYVMGVSVGYTEISRSAHNSDGIPHYTISSSFPTASP
jgi:hypothetical protein